MSEKENETAPAAGDRRERDDNFAENPNVVNATKTFEAENTRASTDFAEEQRALQELRRKSLVGTLDDITFFADSINKIRAVPLQSTKGVFVRVALANLFVVADDTLLVNKFETSKDESVKYQKRVDTLANELVILQRTFAQSMPKTDETITATQVIDARRKVHEAAALRQEILEASQKMKYHDLMMQGISHHIRELQRAKAAGVDVEYEDDDDNEVTVNDTDNEDSK